MDKEFVLNQNLVNAICPRPIGWLEYTLSQTEIDYLWKCVENKGDTVPIFNKLYNIDTFNLEDNNNWFFNNLFFIWKTILWAQIHCISIGKQYFGWNLLSPNSFHVKLEEVSQK